MKKVITSLFLLTVIFFLFSFIYLKISANGPEDNFFNANWRGEIAKNYLARQILGLNDSGDAKYDYLGSDVKEIFIEVDSMAGLKVQNDLFEDLASRISAMTGKPTRYIYSEQDIPYNDADLNKLADEAKLHRVRYRKNSQGVLYILVAGSLIEEPERLGSTLGNDGIVLFFNTLTKYAVEYSANKDPEILNKSAIEVLLHEFGHQLGLEHNANPRCLMSDKTEFSASRMVEDIVFDFCESEKAELSELRKQSARSKFFITASE